MQLSRGLPDLRKIWDRADALLRDPKTGRAMHGQRWRFWCSDCGETLPKVHEKVEPVFIALRRSDTPEISLSQLRRYTR